MKRKQTARTGIDVGQASVKVVRAEGAEAVERFTHVGHRAWERDDGVDPVTAASEALKGVLSDLGLGRNQLGRVVTCIGSPRTYVREVMMPSLTDEEFRQTLPFEARKFLNLDGLDNPIVDGEILEREWDPEGEGRTLVLMAAAEKAHRDFPLKVLMNAGLEPEVVDVEPLAQMRALTFCAVEHEDDPAHAVLDIGTASAHIVVSYRGAGMLSRTLWEGDPPTEAEAESAWLRDIAGRTLETLTFYRGRYRREVEVIHLVGGGAMVQGRTEELSRILNRETVVGRPLTRFAEEAKGFPENVEYESMFITASGLCRWGDS